MKQKESTHARSLMLAGIFSLILGIIICIAIVLRVLFLFIHSSFDRKHQFILFDLQKNNKAQVIVFTPVIQSITITHIIGVNSVSDIEKNLLLPNDAFVNDPAWRVNENNTSFLGRLFFRFSAFRPQGINQADVYKLWMYSKSVSSGSIQEKTVTLPIHISRPDITNDFYVDHTLFQEANTITVVNATGEPGIANTFANVLTTIGGNVIAVTTADQEMDKSVIYAKTRTYTVNRISHLFHMPIIMKNQPLSDIIITIGKNDAHLPYFSL